MAKTKIKYNYKTANYMCLLYPDNKEHMIALEKLKDGYPFIAILHDKDEIEKDVLIDDNELIKEDEPTLKKAHYHVLIKFPNPRYKQAIVDDLNIEPWFIKRVQNYKSSLQYLIHLNREDKYSYDISEVFGPNKIDLERLLNKENKEEDDIFLELMDYIDSCDKLKYKDFLTYCSKKGYFSYVRRASFLYTKIIQEHNDSLNIKSELEWRTRNVKKSMERLHSDNEKLKAENQFQQNIIKEIYDSKENPLENLPF